MADTGLSEAEIDALNARAHALRHQDAHAALALARRAAQAAEARGYAAGVAYAELRTGLLRYMTGEAPELFMPHLSRATAMMRERGDTPGEAEAINLLATMYQTMGQSVLAEEQHRLALVLRRSLGDRAGESASLNNLGLALRDQGRLAEALSLHLAALDLARELDADRHSAYALTAIGRTLAELGDPAAALPRLQEGIALARRSEDRGLECTGLTELGQTQLALSQREAALASLHAAWQLSQATGNAGDQAQVLLALGGLHQTLGAYSTAEERLQMGLVIARRRNDHGACAELLLLLGRNQLLLGQAAAALPLLQEGLALARQHQLTMRTPALHELLSQALEALGDPVQALAHLREFQRARDAAQSQATLRRVQELLVRQRLTGLENEARTQRDLALSLRDALEAARQAEREKAALLAEVAAQAAMLEQLAREDGLTGVANRRWFDSQWPKELERARRHGHALSVAMVDIDNFKAINDRFSHAIGDEVLRRCARTLRDNCRANDLVARYGGEEFVLMFVETPLAGAATWCEKLRQRIAALQWHDLHAELPAVTVSIGLACWTPQSPAAQALRDADAALYRAKAEGKNRVHCAPQATNQERP